MATAVGCSRANVGRVRETETVREGRAGDREEEEEEEKEEEEEEE